MLLQTTFSVCRDLAVTAGSSESQALASSLITAGFGGVFLVFVLFGLARRDAVAAPQIGLRCRDTLQCSLGMLWMGVQTCLELACSGFGV